MDLDARVLVTGRCGWVGNAVVRRLWAAGFHNVRWLGHDELDLTRQAAVEGFFLRDRPQYVFLVAAGAGRSAEPIRDSLAIQANVVHAAWRADVRKFCFLASSAIYPAEPLPPLREGSLLTALLEPGQHDPSIAQLAGIRLCQVYRRQYRFDAISLVPAELYGPDHSFAAAPSALPALVRRLHEARVFGIPEVAIEPLAAREWLQVDDFADAALFLMRRYSDEVPVNVGSGEEIAFTDLVRLVAERVGYRGRLVYAAPGRQAPRQPAETSRLRGMGWEPCMSLRHGVEQACAQVASPRMAMPA